MALEIDKPQVGLSTNSGNSVLTDDFMKANRYGRGERKKAMVVKIIPRRPCVPFLYHVSQIKKRKGIMKDPLQYLSNPKS